VEIKDLIAVEEDLVIKISSTYIRIMIEVV